MPPCDSFFGNGVQDASNEHFMVCWCWEQPQCKLERRSVFKLLLTAELLLVALLAGLRPPAASAQVGTDGPNEEHVLVVY